MAVPCVYLSRALPLTRPRLRYSERYILRLGKSWEACRDVLEAADGRFIAYEAAAAALKTRSRELKNPRPDGWLDRAEKAGLIRRTGGGLQLLEGWEEEEETIRERKGEIAKYVRDRERYKRERMDWLDRLDGEIIKRPPSREEIQARSELEELREAGRGRAQYRRSVNEFRADRLAEKRRQRMSYRTLHALRVMSGADSAIAELADCYRRGETKEFGLLVREVARFYRDVDNWRAWDHPVREAYTELVSADRRRAG